MSERAVVSRVRAVSRGYVCPSEASSLVGFPTCGLSTMEPPTFGCWSLHAGVPTGMPLSAQEVLENLKDRWYQADSPPADLLLTEDEFLSFLHPEHSRGMLKFMVKEIVRDLGKAVPLPGCHPQVPG